VRNQISIAIGFRRTDDLGKYLGVHLIHGRVNRETFQSILTKMDIHLSFEENQLIFCWSCHSYKVCFVGITNVYYAHITYPSLHMWYD